MTTQSYDTNDDVEEAVEFKAGEADTDPTTVKFRYQKPDGTETLLLYPDGIERIDTGKYLVRLWPALPGLWRFRWEGSGNLVAMFTGAFYVRSSFPGIVDKFASVELLGAYLKEDIDPADVMALAALEGATSAIRKYCDQHLSLVTDDEVVLDGTGSDTMLLPEFPVVDVTSVTEDCDLDTPRVLVPPGSGSASEFAFSGESGLLFRRNGSFIVQTGSFSGSFGKFPMRRQSVGVVYTHGYDPIPSELQLLCAAVAARGFAQDGATNETAGSYSASYAGQPVVLTADEKRIADRYRARRK